MLGNAIFGAIVCGFGLSAPRHRGKKNFSSANEKKKETWEAKNRERILPCDLQDAAADEAATLAHVIAVEL